MVTKCEGSVVSDSQTHTFPLKHFMLFSMLRYYAIIFCISCPGFLLPLSAFFFFVEPLIFFLCFYCLSAPRLIRKAFLEVDQFNLCD